MSIALLIQIMGLEMARYIGEIQQDLDKKLAQIIKTIWENYLLVEKTQKKQKISIDQFVKHQREQH